MCVSDMRASEDYNLWYINIARNTVTAGIPLVVLIILNLLVYMHLVERRASVARLGMFT